MLKKLSEKLGAKFPATTRDYSMEKIARLDDAFLEVCKPSRRPITVAKRKEKKTKKRKGEKKSKIRKAKRRSQNFDFCACPSQNVVKRDADG